MKKKRRAGLHLARRYISRSNNNKQTLKMKCQPVKLKVMKAMCSTCPWREGSPMAYLRPDLEAASWKTSRICHSTGTIIVKEAKRFSKNPLICRGSRNYQMHVLAELGFLKEPTDKCWDAKWQEIQTQPKRRK